MTGELVEHGLAEEKFRLAVEACPHGMVMFDADGAMLMVNTEIERQFGYLRTELIGQPVDMLIPARLRSQHARRREAFSRRPQTLPIGSDPDLVGLRKDGSEFFAEVGLTPIGTRDGTLILGVIVDVSERRRNERLKDEFVSTVSHELRTPLTSISGSLGLLVAQWGEKLPESAARLLVIAHKNSQRLVRLIGDILDIEKMEAGRVVFNLSRIDVCVLAEQAVESNRGFADAYGVRIRLDTESGDAEVIADPDRLSQVITNLLSNAVKFSPAGEEVLVVVEKVGEIVRVSVQDRGSGVPVDFRPHVFEKFAQSDATNSRQMGGTGLGLSIVKQIVERLGGEVDFADAPGGGTIFCVELPSRSGAACLDIDREAGPGAARILLCEDDRDTAAAVRQQLRPAGFAVDLAFSAAAAMERAEAIDYVAFLVDLQLPDGDGIGLILHLRDQPKYQETPIVVVSINPSRGREDVRSTRLNVLGWLRKPVDFGQLVHILRNSIISHPSEKPTSLNTTTIESNRHQLPDPSRKTSDVA